MRDSFYDKITAMQVVSNAITGEKYALTFYSDLHDQITDSEDRKLLKKLMKFEESHKNKLQNTYQRLEKFNIWR